MEEISPTAINPAAKPKHIVTERPQQAKKPEPKNEEIETTLFGYENQKMRQTP